MNKKKTKQKKEFPKNFRFFTENFISRYIHKHRRILLIGFTSVLIILGMMAVSIDAYRNYKENQRLIAERSKIGNEIKFWQSVSQKYPNYRDAYLKLAVLNYQLRNLNKAKEYLNKALKVDPNFKEGKKLEDILNEN